MPVGLYGPSWLSKVLGYVWLASILLNIEVVFSFCLLHQGVKSRVREEQQQQHQPMPKCEGRRKTSLYWGDSLSRPDANVRVMTKDIYSLESIRQSLIRQEETLIFALIERAAFRHNEYAYTEKNFTLTPDPEVRLPLRWVRVRVMISLRFCWYTKF